MDPEFSKGGLTVGKGRVREGARKLLLWYNLLLPPLGVLLMGTVDSGLDHRLDYGPWSSPESSFYSVPY